jgi:sigma-54 dependent transcriptional regulator, acetoin dehydrogenase operon transcriptional activator AcoR
MSPPRTGEALREGLAELLQKGEVPDVVREDISASWRRSLSSGLTPDQFAVPHGTDLESDTVLVRAARPVLDSLSDDLGEANVGLLLTESRGQILVRWVPQRSLVARFDHVSLAPGFVYAEQLVGTNGIGTALQTRRPAFVRGDEHFADELTALACAAAPITDPRTGRVLGVVDLTSWARDATPLMLPLARRAAREIEQRLVDDAGAGDRVLLQRFLRERRGAKGPLLLVNDRTVMTNTAAQRLVKPEDEALLRHYAAHVVTGNSSLVPDVVLSNGTSVALRCEPVLDGSMVVGARIRLTPATPDRAAPSSSRSPKPTFGWTGLTDAERSIADLVAAGLTNREVGARLFLSRHTVDYHLRSIFVRLGVDSRVALTRLVLEHEEIAGR